MPKYINAERMPSDKFWEDLTDKEKAKVLNYLLSSPTVDVEEIIREEWVSVEERLPEEWKPVLGMVAIFELPEEPIIDTMIYIGNIAGEDKWRVCWNHDMLESKVTHWMPLPEPPGYRVGE